MCAQDLTKGVKQPTPGLKTSALDFARGWVRKRFTSGPGPYKRLPIVNWSDPDSSARNDEFQGYWEGMSIAVGLPLLFALITLLCGLVFCLGRCACNTFGGRHSTELYKNKEILVHKALTVVFFGLMLILFGIGMSANGGISLSIGASTLVPSTC